jgi:amino-acid N-acetyltransferase
LLHLTIPDAPCRKHSRAYSGSSRPRAKDESPAQPIPQNDLVRERIAERDLYLSVLNATATKRDAKAYLARFKSRSPSKVTATVDEAVSEVAGKDNHDTWRLHRSGVNLGGLYENARSIEESPVFTYEIPPDKFVPESQEPLHVAVVKLRAPESLDDKTLSGVGLTLAQLTRLGMVSAVVVDCDEANVPEQPDQVTGKWRKEILEQCTRVAAAIQEHSKTGARVVDQLLTVSPVQREVPCRVHVRGGVEVGMRELLHTPLQSGTIPIIPPFAYTATSVQRIQPDDAVLALTRELAGLTSRSADKQDVQSMSESLTSASKAVVEPVSLDRVIVLDPLGGLPTPDDPNQSHIFVNLEQEYTDVRKGLVRRAKTSTDTITSPPVEKKFSILGASNPFSKFFETEVKPPLGQLESSDPKAAQPQQPAKANRFVKNLDLIQRCLTLLPPTSSALLTTPTEAASSALSGFDDDEATVTRVGTRAKRNPLIHNLLTDKPIISSSLPAGRLTQPLQATSSFTPATFFKRGMPVTIVPDPRISPWQPPGPHTASLRLESDPRIDFPRLLHLIEDSFGRKLDVHDYLSRIKDRIAGVIIAGEYEGGAILTWESPPLSTKDGSPRPPLPYLDKFAVLRKSQGSGGVADVVFNAMVRDCLPEGVVWRSRRENPVNKWYFERSVGTWKIPDSQWTMFWTGSDVDWGQEESETGKESKQPVVKGDEERKLRWNDFVAVCEGIQASWADTKPPD